MGEMTESYSTHLRNHSPLNHVFQKRIVFQGCWISSEGDSEETEGSGGRLGDPENEMLRLASKSLHSPLNQSILGRGCEGLSQPDHIVIVQSRNPLKIHKVTNRGRCNTDRGIVQMCKLVRVEEDE